MLKTCRVCATLKPIAGFRKHARGLFGVDSICKPCHKAKTYAWRSANPGGHAAMQRLYRRKNPAAVKASLKKWHEANPDYERDRSRARYADPVERKRIRAATRRWMKKNPQRVCASAANYAHLKRANGGAGLSVEQVVDLLSRPCHYCGAIATTLDHVIPVSRGEKHDPENVVPACRPCNSSKGARTPEEWTMRPRDGRSIANAS